MISSVMPTISWKKKNDDWHLHIYLFLFQILVNKHCTLNSESYLIHGLLETSNSSVPSSIQPSQETRAASVINDNSFKTQPSLAQDHPFGSFQTRNSFSTTGDDSHKFRSDSVYNTKHGHDLDYSDKESVYKVKNNQNHVENFTLPVAFEYIQKRSINMSTAYRTITNYPQAKIAEKSFIRESDSVSEKCMNNSKSVKCRTKRSLVKFSYNLKDDTRTRIRRSDEKKENYNSDINNVQSSADLHIIYQVDNQTNNQQLNESPVISIYPQYFVYTWVLCMVALASFLKLNYLVKTIVLVFMVTCYGILIIHFSTEINQCCG